VAIQRVPIGVLVNYLVWCYEHKCGYIMGAYGQDPKKWSKDSWWYQQYKGEQLRKALWWRDHAPLVHDCNGLAEGGYQAETGVNINARARNNYATWCSPKGHGRIPAKQRVPGATVFIDNGSYVSHVGYLWKPVDANKPSGDWWVIEARGVMYGAVKSRLYARGWNRWGWMTKYFDYSSTASEPAQEAPEFGHRTLRMGDEGTDVKQLQLALITLNYSCGKWGADGEFGGATRNAVKAFQKDAGLAANGVVEDKTYAAINERLPEDGDDPVDPPAELRQMVRITGESVWIRTQPSTGGATLGVAKYGDKLPYRGQPSALGWIAVDLDGEDGWVSEKYAEVMV
jgi:hypothetical protein